MRMSRDKSRVFFWCSQESVFGNRDTLSSVVVLSLIVIRVLLRSWIRESLTLLFAVKSLSIFSPTLFLVQSMQYCLENQY